MYNGDYVNNEKSGFGTKTFAASGSRYKGYWKKDKMDGEGEFTWSQGDFYKGHYRNGYRDGFGTKVWASGTKYTVYMLKY